MAAWIALTLWICVDLIANQSVASNDLRAGNSTGTKPGQLLETPAAVHVRVDQDGRLSAPELRVVIEEIEKIWGAVGVLVTSGRYADPVPADRAIVSMRIVAVQVPPGEHPVLGWVTGDVYHQQTPIIFVSRSGITNLLATATFSGSSLSVQSANFRDRLAAQAMGRVAAHELGHYFLRSGHHHKRGLMRSNYSTADLTAPSLKPFKMPETERVALRQEVARLTQSQTR